MVFIILFWLLSDNFRELILSTKPIFMIAEQAVSHYFHILAELPKENVTENESSS